METAKKNFRKRTAILSFLRQTKDHPSAEMVFNHLKQEIPICLWARCIAT